MNATVIDLASPFEFQGRKVAKLTIKEPTGAQYAEIGEPLVMVYLPNGGGYAIEQSAAINRYLEACLEHDLGSDALKQLGLTDARKVKRALLDFFSDAEAPKPREESTNSSSSPAR
jgi:hypothetical protein